MKRSCLALALALAALVGDSCSAHAAEPESGERTGDARVKKVLLIGVDGCRFDALEAAETPNFDRLLENGCFDRDCQILGDRYRGNDTISGPGWSSILCGVWADKHSVDGNDFNTPNYEDYPHFFARLKEEQPEAVTASFIGWSPIQTTITSAADVNESSDEGGLDYPEKDEHTIAKATEYLAANDPTATFVYFAQVDGRGHGFGFHPSVPEYIAAIERVDGHIGSLLDTLESRPNYEHEDWLIVVVADHGGQGKTHSNGHNVPEILNSFLIVSGDDAARGEIEETTYLVDVVPTLLAHLGVEPHEEWGLDGHAVGLVQSEESAGP